MTEGGSSPEDADEQARPTPDLVEETRRIVGAVQDWMQRTIPEAHGGPDCQWCPICQFAGVLRGERPEVAEKLAVAGAAFADALKSIVDVAATHATAPAGTPQRAEGERPRPRPRVERIDLDEADEADEADDAP